MTYTHTKLTGRLSIKVTPDQLRRWRRAARADGRDLSNWVRWVLLQASEPEDSNVGTLELDGEADKQNNERGGRRG